MKFAEFHFIKVVLILSAIIHFSQPTLVFNTNIRLEFLIIIH